MRHAMTTDRVAVAFTDLGEARDDRPALLLAHATGFHGHVWLPLVAELTPAFRCIVFDERGHGDTEPPPDGVFAWTGFALDALAVVDELGLERPYAVGHSAGGAALVLAELERPGTFERLYCYEPIVPPITEDGGSAVAMRDNPLAASARRRRERFASKDEAFANYASKPPLDVFRDDALRAYVDHGFTSDGGDDGAVRLKCRPESEAATYEMSVGHGAYLRLGEIGCPVTVACGELTTTFGVGAFEMIAERLPEGTLDVLPGLGHFGPMQDPAAVAASVLRAFSVSRR